MTGFGSISSDAGTLNPFVILSNGSTILLLTVHVGTLSPGSGSDNSISNVSVAFEIYFFSLSTLLSTIHPSIT